jgi:histidine decarboxylase
MFEIKNAVSPYLEYCTGYGNPGASGDSYVCGLAIASATAPIMFGAENNNLLDKINAFDICETKGPYIGQINMITVSSFCGLQGGLVGYHFLSDFDENADFLFEAEHANKRVPVYSARCIYDATKAIFGTVNNRKFPLIPGGHIPCANKAIEVFGQKKIYSAIAIGIAEDRTKNANLFMEDVGEIGNTELQSIESEKRVILDNVARSILQVGENQNVRFTKILSLVDITNVNDGDVGCSLVAAPYFNLARGVLPVGYNWDDLRQMKLLDWEKLVGM